tara:strand:+ start:289 stop:408 length:120 start_codon:yes stop_codon:yes gene_type:complete
MSKNEKKPNKNKKTLTYINTYNNKKNKTIKTHEKKFVKK